MKILLINSVYEKGSTGNIVKSLYTGYREFGHDVFVIYGRGNKTITKQDNHIFNETSELESKLHHLLSKFTGNMYGGMHLSTRKIIKRIKSIDPDAIHLHCLNGYFVNIYKLLRYLKTTNKKIILTMHADFMMTGGCGISEECDNYLTCSCKSCKNVRLFNGKSSLNRTHHFYEKMKNTIKGYDKNNIIITCVSPWLAARYKKSPIYSWLDIISILNPIPQDFLSNYGKNPYSDKNNILFVTPDFYDPLKGGKFIEFLATRLPQYTFTIINAKSQQYKANTSNIDYISGGMERVKLKSYYHFANATLLLSIRETFSMIVAESLSCGTPVLGFKAGGPEEIGINDYCTFVDYGNIDLLINLINKTMHEQIDKSLINKLAQDKYSIKKISAEYLALMEKTNE